MYLVFSAEYLAKKPGVGEPKRSVLLSMFEPSFREHPQYSPLPWATTEWAFWNNFSQDKSQATEHPTKTLPTSFSCLSVCSQLATNCQKGFAQTYRKNQEIDFLDPLSQKTCTFQSFEETTTIARLFLESP